MICGISSVQNSLPPWSAPSNIYSCTSIQHNLTYLTFLQSAFIYFAPFLQSITLSFVNLVEFRQKRLEIVSHQTLSTLTLFNFFLGGILQSQLHLLISIF